MRSSAPARSRSRSAASVRNAATSASVGPYFRCSCFRSAIRCADGLETLGVGKERLPVGAHVPGELGDLGGEPPGPLGHLPRRRIELRRALQDRRQPGRGVRDALLPGEGVLGGGGLFQESLDMPEPSLLDFQFFGLAVAGTDGFDLVHLVREQVELPLPAARRLLQLVELGSDGAQPIERLAIRPERDEMSVAGGAVQEAGLHGGREQSLRLPLPVVFDQPGAELGQRRGRRELTPDARGRSAVPRDRPREDHLAVLRPVAGRVGGVEPGLHASRGRSLPNERGRPPLAERQQESHGDHRLAGARLACEHVQPGRELELEVVDHPEATDVELAQHGEDASDLP